MLGEDRLIAVKDGPNVQYIRHPDAFQNFKIIGFRLIKMIQNGVIKPEDIFVLAPSVKSENSPVKMIENMLVNNNIPCFVPMSETSSISSEIIKNKVIFSSFHQSKGRERKIVVVYGFDDTYFAYFNKDSPVDICPSTLYVAATRATELLILVDSSKPLPFLKYNHRDLTSDECDFVDFIGDPLNIITINERVRPKSPENIRRTSPTDMIKFLDENVLINIMQLIDNDTPLFTNDYKSFPFQEVKINGVINTKYNNINLHEEVFDINGLAIPALFEERNSDNKTNTIKRYVKQIMENPNNVNSYQIHKSVLKNVDLNSKDDDRLENLLRIVNVYISIKEKLNFKVVQINEYDWLSESDVNKLLMNMDRHIKNPKQLCYEVEIIKKNDDKQHVMIDHFVKTHMGERFGKLRFTAIVDAMSDSLIWEFKCTDEIEAEHLLQVIIYAWIWKLTCEEECGPRTFKILNIKTAEVQTLTYNSVIIDNIILMILRAKYNKLIVLSDDEFIHKCLMYIN